MPTALGIPFIVVGGRRIVEIAKANFEISRNSGVNAVCVLHNTVVHIADSVCNVVFPIQTFRSVLARKLLYFGGQFLGFFSGDELGGLNTVHQKPEFVRLKGRVQEPIPLLVGV